MINDFVGIGDLSQGLAFVTLLPTRFLARPFAQTRHPRRLRQPIARRRLAAVRAVPPEPTLKFGDLRLKSRDLACLAATNAISSSRDGSAAELAFIESLNSKADSRVSQIYTLGSPKSLRQPRQLRTNEQSPEVETSEDCEEGRKTVVQ